MNFASLLCFNKTAMPNTIDAPPPVYEQIENALHSLGKEGYSANAHEEPSGELSVVFTFGASEQSFKFRKNEWQSPGAVERKIVDDLNI